MDQANYPWHPSILHSNKRLSSLPGIRTHRPCGRNMLRPGSFTRRGLVQRTRPPWKISRPDVEVAWWPLGRCCIHLACIAAHLSIRPHSPAMVCCALMSYLWASQQQHPSREEKPPGELSLECGAATSFPGCLSVPPSEMIFMRVASAQSIQSRFWVCMDTEVLISYVHFYVFLLVSLRVEAYASASK